jgi:hypothetical protein
MNEAKLVDDIRAALKSGTAHAEVPRLGPGYAQARAEAKRRLEKCVELLRLKKDNAALQEAQFNPPLMNVVEVLSFPQAREWEEMMEMAGIPPGLGFDARHIDMVGNLYTKKIDGSDPLYKDLALAMRRKDFDQALVILRLIRRKNPGDKNAADQIAKVEKRVQTRRLEELGAIVEAKDEGGFADAMGFFESEPWETKPAGALWEGAILYQAEIEKKKALARCKQLIEQVEETRRKGNWQQTAGILTTVRSLISANGFALDEEFPGAPEKSYKTVVELCGKWVNQRTAKEKKNREEKSRLDRLQVTLRKIQDKEIGRKRPTAELRADLAELSSVARDLQDAGQSLSDKALQAFNRSLEKLRADIARRQKNLRLMIAAGCVAVLAVAIPTFMAIAASLERGDQLEQLNKGVAGIENTVELEAFLNSFEKNHPGRETDPGFVAEFQKGRGLVKKAKEVLEDFSERAQTLQATLANLEKPQEMGPLQNDRQAIWEDLPKLNVAYRQSEEERLRQIDLLWNDKRDNLQSKIAGGLGQQLNEANAFADNNTSLELAAGALKENLKLLNRKLIALETELADIAGVEGLGLSKGQQDLLASLRSTYDGRMKTLSDYDAVLASMGTVDSVESLFAVCQKILGSGLLNEPATQKAKEILQNKGALEGLPATVFMPKNPANWESFAGEISGSYKPETVLGEETEVLKKLFLDKRLKRVQSHQLVKVNYSEMVKKKVNAGWSLKNPPKESRTAWTLGQPADPLINFKGGARNSIGINPNPGKYEMAQAAQQIVGGTTEIITYSSQWTGVENTDLKPIGDSVRVTGEVLLGGKHFEGLSKLSFESSYLFPDSPGKGTVMALFDLPQVNRPLLQFLDELKVAPIDPLIKALIHLRFMETMSIRPHEWGLKNEPTGKLASLHDYESLKKLCGGMDLVAEWYKVLSSGKETANRQKIASFYAQTISRSYYKEARFFEKFWKLLLKADFKYHGYCKLDDSWSKPLAEPAWAIGNRTKGLEIVRAGGGEAIPLSPILTLNLSIPEVLLEARSHASMSGPKDPDYVRIKPLLPYPFPLYPEK